MCDRALYLERDPGPVVGMEHGFPGFEGSGERRALHAEELGGVRVPFDTPARKIPRPTAHAGGPHGEGEALVELGYTLVEAEQALARIDPELPPEERVRLALRAA